MNNAPGIVMLVTIADGRSRSFKEQGIPVIHGCQEGKPRTVGEAVPDDYAQLIGGIHLRSCRVYAPSDIIVNDIIVGVGELKGIRYWPPIKNPNL